MGYVPPQRNVIQKADKISHIDMIQIPKQGFTLLQTAVLSYSQSLPTLFLSFGTYGLLNVII